MKSLIEDKLEFFFKENFGIKPKNIFKAPGRVNLMGEHLDYNFCSVLPCAIDAYTYIAMAPSDDKFFHAVSNNFPGTKSSWLPGKEQIHDSKASWADHLKGLTAEIYKKNLKLIPMNLAVISDVPMGCGLSSSAALQMAFALGMKELNHLNLGFLELAQLAKASENNFVGSQCGIMDQLVSGTAKKLHASLIDCESLTWNHIPLDPRWKILVIHSGVNRTLKGSSFNTRVEECARARNILPGKIKNLKLEDLEPYKNDLEEASYRRARHVISESKRVMLFTKALQSFDEKAVYRMMSESHKSMDEDFEITVPEVNIIFNLVKKRLEGRGGIRLTGAGFGGALVVLTSESKVPMIRNLILESYNLEGRSQAQFFSFNTSDGGSRVY